MFGGAGVYYRDVMFALISNETLYLKADAFNQEMFKEAGADRFHFKPQSGKNAGKKIAMSFWELPEELLDDPDALVKQLQVAGANVNYVEIQLVCQRIRFVARNELRCMSLSEAGIVDVLALDHW